jgi:hypothetical protein
MVSRRMQKAEKAMRLAESDLVEADELAEDPSPEIQKQAREMRRAAKRRRARANRRMGRAVCDYEEEENEA